MMKREFWVMVKKQGTGGSQLPGYQPWSFFPAISIVELTEDELVYIWPLFPKFDSLCLICRNMNQRCHDCCQTNVLPGYPCGFEAVPESVQCLDLDDFLIDGEYLDECGYYISFEAFKQQNALTEKDFYFYGLGSYPSIRAARHALITLTDVLCGRT